MADEPAADDPAPSRRNAYLIGVLVVVVIGLGVGLALALSSDDEPPEPGARTTATAGTTTTTGSTQTPTTQKPTTPTSTTTGPATLTQAQAKAEARDQASITAREDGVDLAPGDFDAQCTGEGGSSSTLTWSCSVSSTNGQCAGEVTVVATGGARAGRTDTVTCG